MKLPYKLIALFGIPLGLFGVLGFYNYHTTEQSLSREIKRTSATKALSVINEIDHNFHNVTTEWIAFVRRSIVKQSLRESNSQFSQVSNVQEMIDSRDAIWQADLEGDSSPLIETLIQNELSDELRIRLGVYEQWKGYPVFGEVFITNRYGANIALTGRTSDYRQNDELWWQRAVERGVYLSEVDYDDSAKLNSIDICIRIDDDNGELLGVLKAVMNIKEIVNIIDSHANKQVFESVPELILFDDQQRILRQTHLDSHLLLDGSDYFNDIAFAKNKQVVTIERKNSRTSKEVLASYAFSKGFGASPSTGWCLLIEFDKTDVFKPIEHQKTRGIIFIFIGSSLTMLIGGMLVFSITRRINKLQNATQLISKGELGAVVQAQGSDEIGELGRCFNRMSQDLEVADRNLREAIKSANSANLAKSQFLANMSHEIRTPMTSILGFTNILLENLKNQEDIRAAETIKSNGEYLLELINDILDLSKIEAHKIDIEKVECSSSAVIKDVVSLMSVRAIEKGLTMSMRFDGLFPEKIKTDPTCLRQILINVIGNAIKFTESGAVEIVSRFLQKKGENSKVQFCVIDTGIGIEKSAIDSLFQPFSQADNSTTRIYGGTGLGLTISQRLANLLGGDISVTSRLGQGSSFTITIDVGNLDGVDLIEKSHISFPRDEKKAVTNQPNATSLHGRILLAEDGLDNQRLLSFILNKAGANVSIAENGQIAYETAMAALNEGNPFDVILMDMQMPVLDGYDACRRLRDHEYQGAIIALTANAMTDDRQKCLDAGCDDYTTKPIDKEQLLSTISSYMNDSSVAE